MTQSDERKEHGQPIVTPPPESDKHWMEVEPNPNRDHNPFRRFAIGLLNLFAKPAVWFRESVVEPNRGPKYYWFHKKFSRALPIDECYIDDLACLYEANLEYMRLKLVDRATLDLLKFRRDECYMYYKDEKGFDVRPSKRCKEILETFEREQLNFFIKYGELRFKATVLDAYTKQKHRMIMERRRAAMNKENMEDVNAQHDQSL